MSHYNILDGLNTSQGESVEIINGPILILAGAGTGKTKVITHRIANLMKNWILPENILGLTFTNKAAKEMKERVRLLVDFESASKIFLGTFHAFFMRVLRTEVQATRLHRGFAIADELDQKGTLKQVIAELKIKEEDSNVNLYASRIGRAKQELKSWEKYKAEAKTYIENVIAKVYQKYQEMLTSQNMLDFDDILNYTIEIWEKNPEILNKYQEQYKYILIDEFQDTNYAQFRLIKLLADKYKNICVVGDDDQSIYGWRGAKVENILDFPNIYPNTSVIKLEQNYRSTNNILKVANVFISGNKHRHNKKLWSENGEGDKIKTISLQSDAGEAVFVSSQIRKLVYEHHDIKYNDIAILYRSNHQSRLFEQQFRHDRVPYKIVGSKSFYERKEIRDAIAYLKIIANSKDDQSLLRILGVPSRNLGQKFIQTVRARQAHGVSILDIFADKVFCGTLPKKQTASVEAFSDTVEKWRKEFSEAGDLAGKTRNYLIEIGFLNCFQKLYKNIDEAEDRRENVLEFINAIAEFEDNRAQNIPTLGEYLETFCLSDDSDNVDGDRENDSATLLTVHSAKGLEFKCVFIVGMEQNLFPHARSLEDRDIDEERRLFYVAITRAKTQLFITNSKNRYQYGKPFYQIPSEFLSELPEDLIDDLSSHENSPVEHDTVSSAFTNFYKQFTKNDEEIEN